MKSNNLFTYVLYALLGVLLLTVGYLALEKRKEQARKDEEMRRDREQLERSLADLNTVGDTASAGQSAYVGESATKKPAANANGIEDEPAASTAKSSTAKPATAPAPLTKPVTSATTASKPVTTTKPVTDPKKLVAKSVTTTTTSKQSVAPSTSGRYLVVVGAFSQVENARTEMEKYVKMGYQDAEVVKYKTDLWRVIAKRCAKRTDAQKIEADLEKRGVDAMVVDGYAK